MAKSKITITIIAVPIDLDRLVFNNNQVIGTEGIVEIFKPIRSGNQQVTIGISTHQTANNLYNALIADYGQDGLYNFVINGNIVTITSMVSNTIFTETSVVGPFDVVIENNTEQVPISISSVVFSTNSVNPCDTVKVNVQTNVLATKYYVNGVEYANSLNPFSYNMPRNATQTLVVEAIDLTTDNETVKSPSQLSTGNTALEIINSPNGATVTVTLAYNYLLTPEYSLDSVTWQTSNVFTGILPGNYTVYVRDQYGCLINKAFVVEAFAPVTTVDCNFSYISDSMSIRFKRNEEWNDTDIFKTVKNTLSCEEEVSVPYKFIQKFRPSNIVTTQLLSNYTNISANIIKEDLTKVAIPIVKNTQFLDIQDSRDCNFYSLGSGKCGVYYTTGKTYDYTTGFENGTYALNGALPEYGEIGQDININGIGWVRVTDIIYNESLNADVLVFSYTYAGVPEVRVVKCEYNQQNFNVYEFKVDFALYIDEYIQIEILQAMEGFPDYNYLSEVCECRESYKNCVELIWYNNADSSVFYSTGIRNIGNLEFESFDIAVDSELTINKTANTTIVVEARNYKNKELVLDAVSNGIANQLLESLLHKHLFINRLSYVASATPSTETLASTNLVSITAPLVSTDRPYETTSP